MNAAETKTKETNTSSFLGEQVEAAMRVYRHLEKNNSEPVNRKGQSGLGCFHVCSKMLHIIYQPVVVNTVLFAWPLGEPLRHNTAHLVWTHMSLSAVSTFIFLMI